MTGEVIAPRSHPAVIAAWIVAAIAVTAFALVAIAYLLGWVPSKAAGSSPVSVAVPGSQVAGSAPDVALLPGETLVEPMPAAGPTGTTAGIAPVPSAAPSPARSAPPAAPPPPKATQPTTPSPAAPAASPPAPKKPAYARAEPPPVTSYDRASRSLCINCGTVTSVSGSSGEWEVRVRFEDGSSDVVTSRERPRARVGDKVYMEDGRLFPNP